ncbi:hypothetical protein RHGRI_017340 [Rhododendron griersonianum]|uniref:Small ribosomal subunit protein mS29 n=1 Tax=Rhododendron griersonianum TaxID=479676 RepID=A0AAV6JXE1_9ERIC|nr:hypothetical protein RHGRI_017340 [Rhododendron griersonianum]
MNNKAVVTQAKKGKSKSDAKSDTSSSAVSAAADEFDDEDVRARRLAEDESNRSLNVGPNGRPLFTSTPSLSQLSRTDTCTYMKFRRIVDPPLQSFDAEGWLVVYVPNGREWTHGGVFYKNPQTGFWDTPVQAANALQARMWFFLLLGLGFVWAAELKLLLNTKYDFLKYNESRLQQLPCQISDPILLGEGAGVGWMKGVDSMEMPEGSMLYDLIQTGVTHTHAAYNNWFTFSGCEELVTVRSCRPVHARELAIVNAFRSMMHNDMMVGAFSHSTAVGKLRKGLPDVPVDARVNFARYNLDEAAAVCHYYLRQRLVRREAFSEEGWKKIFFLTNGNGSEMRWLLPFMR